MRELNEENNTHPIENSMKAMDKDSLANSQSTSGIYSITTRDNIGAYHSQHGMYKQYSSRASQMSGSNIAERKINRLDPEHRFRKREQIFDTRSLSSMHSIARSHLSMGRSEIMDSDEKQEEERKLKRIERFW